MQIRELIPLEAGKRVPSGQNPADVASRGCKASQLKAEQNWWEGPAFLKKEEEFWSEQKNVGLLNFEFSDISEINKIKKVTTHLVEDLVEGLGNVKRPEDHSDLSPQSMVRPCSSVRKGGTSTQSYFQQSNDTARKAKYSGPNSLEYGSAHAAYAAMLTYSITSDSKYTWNILEESGLFSVFKFSTRE